MIVSGVLQCFSFNKKWSGKESNKKKKTFHFVHHFAMLNTLT